MKLGINAFESVIVVASCLYVFCVGGDPTILWIAAAFMCLVPPIFMIAELFQPSDYNAAADRRSPFPVEVCLATAIGGRAAKVVMIVVLLSVAIFCVYVYFFYEFQNFSGMSYP